MLDRLLESLISLIPWTIAALAVVWFLRTITPQIVAFLSHLVGKLQEHDLAHQRTEMKLDALHDRVNGLATSLGVAQRVDQAVLEARLAKEKATEAVEVARANSSPDLGPALAYPPPSRGGR